MNLLSKRPHAPQTGDARAESKAKSRAAEATRTDSAPPALAAIHNSLGMTLVPIPAGEFWMGRAESTDELARAFPHYEAERLTALFDEQPLHRVHITRRFLLGAHAVTLGQFRAFVERSGYRTEAERDGTGGWGYNPAIAYFEGRKLEYSWRDPGFPQDDRHPVVNVTWNDAVALCEWLSRQEGRHYRLPSEAEWEYACRAGTTTRFHSGDSPDDLARVANLYDAACRPLFPQWEKFALPAQDGFAFTAPVGSFAANAFGLFDMHGNVWEWCADWYADDYYRHAPLEDPPGPAEGVVRVRRGGSWHSWPLYARSAYRNWNAPETRYVLVGMRLACDAET
jgi:formylglycine-generating enzyme required for sulfatase activity